MSKAISMFKKIKTISKNGLEPINEGKENYFSDLPVVELLALERAKECGMCPNFVDEPIDMFKIQDKRIKELSNKMCDECGCSIPYLLRQNIKICKNWEK